MHLSINGRTTCNHDKGPFSVYKVRLNHLRVVGVDGAICPNSDT